jgi:UDPglucose 6-dehydrogenase
MKICVIGTGYVGLITGCGFAKLGHEVTCVDIDQKKVDMIKKGIPPIFENGLKELLHEVIGKKLNVTTDLKAAVTGSEIVFITVGTPSLQDGSIDSSYVQSAFSSTMDALTEYKVIVVKSTVVPGTTDSLAQHAAEKFSKKSNMHYGLCMNPEFLREGKAIDDFFNPDRIVLGVSDEKTEKKMKELYSSFKCPVIISDTKTAEMIKYASNAFLATKISFANEFGNLCKVLGIDVYDVMDAIGMDKRIGRQFLNAGIGWGGSCFPKDVKAITASFKKNKIEPKILDAVIETNNHQPQKLVDLAKKKLKLRGMDIAVLGLAFKPDSDDMREAPSIKIIESLLKEGAKIVAYDPEAMENAKKIFGEKIAYSTSAKDAISKSSAVFILTEWKEFSDERLYSGKVVFDGRKVLKKKSGKDYEGICW